MKKCVYPSGRLTIGEVFQWQSRQGRRTYSKGMPVGWLVVVQKGLASALTHGYVPKYRGTYMTGPKKTLDISRPKETFSCHMAETK